MADRNAWALIDGSVEARTVRHFSRLARARVPAEERGPIVSMMAAAVASAVGESIGHAPPPALSPPMEEAASAAAGLLATQGLCRLGSILPSGEASDARHALSQRPAYSGHTYGASDRVSRPLSEIASTSPFASYALGDVARAPGLMALANHPMVLRIAETFLGCPPTLYQASAFWSFAGRQRPADIGQRFHRDPDGSGAMKFCVLMVFLTDVDADDGAHQFVTSSQSFAGVESRLSARNARAAREHQVGIDELKRADGYGHDDLYRELFADRIETVSGPAGYAFMGDFSALHRGVPPLRRDRLVFWARYGLIDPGLTADVGPCEHEVMMRAVAPRDHRALYVNRALLRPMSVV